MRALAARRTVDGVLLLACVVVVLGALMLAFSGAIANVTFELRDRRIASSSYQAPDRVAERREEMRSPANRSFDVARVRVTGGVLIFGGAIGIVHGLGI
jgi:hypothetical protein